MILIAASQVNGCEEGMLKSDEIFCLKRKLELTDASMARIGEDLIRILVQRGFIKYSDLSDQSREKIKERDELRVELRKLMSLAEGRTMHGHH